jgi:hypothetical protein
VDDVVMLVGGPFDGLPWKVDRLGDEVTLVYDDGPAEHWPSPARRTGLASYRRRDETTWDYCPTQTAMGATDVEWWETQLGLEDDDWF